MTLPSRIPAAPLLLALLLGAGCGRGPGSEHDPRPLRMWPARGVRQVPLAVRIEGENFQALAVRQLSGGAALRVDRGFAAFLGEVALEDVEWVDAQTLRARVPAGLEPGHHPLRVVSPLGRTVQLERAFLVAAGPFAGLVPGAEVARAALLVGQEAQVSLSLANPGDVPARDVVAGLQVEGPATVQPVEEGPVGELAPGGSVTRHWRVQATGAGALTLRFSAGGTDAESGLALAPEALPERTVQVYTPAALAAQGALTLAQVSMGQELEASLTVLNEGGSTAQAVQPELQTLGEGRVQVLQAPLAQDVPGGALRTFRWHLRAQAAGALQVAAQARGTEALSGAELSTGLAPAGALRVQWPAALVGSAAGPGQVSVGQPFTASLTVRNEGEALARAVLPTPPQLSGAPAQLLSTPGAQDLPGGAQHTFTWGVLATGPGTLQLSAGAEGADDNSGAAVGTGPLSAPPTRVQAAAALRGVARATPGRVSLGQALEVELEVHNDGEADALDVLPAAPTKQGSGALTLVSGPTASVTVPGGGSHLFTWSYAASVAGDVALVTGASGRDANSGAAVDTAAVPVPVVGVQAPAALAATLTAPAQVSSGQRFALTLTVHNEGGADALEVAPGLPALAGSGAATVLAGPVPQSATLAGGGRQVFTWELQVTQAGTLRFDVGASGRDANSGAALALAVPTSVQLVAERAAALAGTLVAPGEVNVVQPFLVTLTVQNTGEAAALGVLPAEPVVTGNAGAQRLTAPSPQEVPGGAQRTFTWSYQATSPGDLAFVVEAQGQDVHSGASVSTGPVTGSPVEVRTLAALLASSLHAPAIAGVGETFTVTMTVRNDGAATAREVAPSVLQLSGSATAARVSGPTPATWDSLPGGQAQDFTWRYTATSEGSLALSGNATGTDANSGLPLASATSGATSSLIRRATEVASDPFGDGTSFAYVFSHHGQLHLGPNKTGSGGVRSNPDGSAPQSFSFRFAPDVTGSNTSKNASPAPYPSIGSKGCVEDTPACGPNNEAGRGLLFHGNLGGQDWLGVVGAHPSYKVTYLYLTPDSDPELDFRYVDLDGNLPGTSLGFSAAHFYGSNLYVGVATTGGARPGLLAITRMPNLPGLEGNDTDVAQLELSTFPHFGSRGTPSNPATMIMIDAMAQFGGKLYLANNGGCVRSTRLAPRSYKDFPGDWANCTPNLAAYTGLTSVTVSQVGELEPADRAVPKMVAFGERLYLARNTTLGPQLFACTPGATGFANDCDPGDWSLVAPNSVGDARLTQFDLPDNARITLLAATASHLYVGFNNASTGLVLFRTALPTASARSDFRGLLECPADQAATTCQGLGQNGLGVGATRIFDGTALDFEGRSYLYLTAGTGTGPVRVFRIAD